MEKSVCFIVNGNHEIGLGHVYRCMALGKEAIARGLKVYFLFPRTEMLLKIFVKHSEYHLLHIESDIWKSIGENQSKIKSLLFGIKYVIIDLLQNEFLYFSFLGGMNFRIASITAFYFPETIRYEDISFFPGMERIDKNQIINNGKVIQLFSGPEYLTFREEFRNSSNQETVDVPENIPIFLISMGGTDAFGFTSMIVKELDFLPFDFKAIIVLKTSAKSYEEVARNIIGDSRFKLINEVENMAALMRKTTIAIINGGLTRYELTVVGTPFIAVSVHTKQYEITDRLTSLTNAVNLGIADKLNSGEIGQAVKELVLDKSRRQEISKNSKKLIDTKGNERILDLVLKIEKI